MLIACLASGCEIGRTMFQMDSNSGQPFFGLDLIPRKTTRKAAPVQADQSAQVLPVRNASSNAPRPSAPVASVATATRPEPSLLERLKLRKPPERIALDLQTVDEESISSPIEEFR